MSFDPATGRFRLTYVPDHVVSAPTVIMVPTLIHYPTGYCPRVSGGSVISGTGSQFLEVADAPSAHLVTVGVTAGPCAPTAEARR